MATLSVSKDGLSALVVAASPIYVLSDPSQANRIAFEVLSRDGVRLIELVGKPQIYALDDEAFWGRLEALDEVDPSHPTTKVMGRPVMRGEIRRLSGPTGTENLQ